MKNIYLKAKQNIRLMQGRMAVAAMMLCASAATMNAQTVDGRNFGIDGFAACTGTQGTPYYRANGTTGGEGGKVVYAENFSQLQAYLQAEDPYIILVDKDMTTGVKCYVESLDTGKLCDKQDGSEGVESTYGERIMIASNKTLIGVANPETGEAPLFSRITFVMQTVDNIIIRNCRFTMEGVPVLKSGENKIVALRDGVQKEVGDPDCIGIQADETSDKTDWGGHIWVDHCEFFNGYAENKDRYDGLLDCKNNVQWLTISYNHFHDHNKSCLFGKGGSDMYDRTISMHHNLFEDIKGSRLPLQRGGYLHYMNNYMVGCQDGWDVREESIGYLDACYCDSTKSPVRSDRGGALNINKSEGYNSIFRSCNNLPAGYTNIDGAKYKSLRVTPTSWLPTQTDAAYRVNHHDKTEDVPDICKKYAGAGKIEIYKAYTSVIPKADINEYANAVKHYATAPTYDASGNKVTDVITGISTVKPLMAQTTRYYNIEGKELAAPQRGLNIVRTVDTQGHVTVKKIMMH